MRYLVPKQLKANGLREGELAIAESAIRDIIRYYTRESGVRNLEREIAKICRKVVKEIALAGPKPPRRARKPARSTSPARTSTSTSACAFDFGRAEAENEVGLVTGLAWTEVGGDLLQIESTLVPGKGALILTGQLGDVMKESASAALSRGARAHRTPRHRPRLPAEARRARARARRRHAQGRSQRGHRDGDVAGVDADRIPVRSDVAMTGEITLRGKVTAIGGLKEKLLAALRGGIKTVLIPDENRKDLADIPKNVTQH